MISKRETDGRYALRLNSKRSVSKFEQREQERQSRRQQLYSDALARGLTPQQAEEEMYLFA